MLGYPFTGMGIENPEFIRHQVTPTETTWNLCIEIAKERGVTPAVVLNEMIYIGEVVLKVEGARGALGEVIWRNTDGAEVPLRDELNKGKK